MRPCFFRAVDVARQATTLLCWVAAAAGAVAWAGSDQPADPTAAERTVTRAAPQPQTPVVRVEEDWELVVAEPAPQKDSPQVTNVLSPVSSLSDLYAVLELNYQTLPDYAAGGLSLQVWRGDVNLDYTVTPLLFRLATPGERVSYTLALQVSRGRLTVELCNLQSSTWNGFRSLKLQVPTELRDLSGYSVEFSLSNSGVTFGTNRVERFRLKEVRFLDASGKVLHRWRRERRQDATSGASDDANEKPPERPSDGQVGWRLERWLQRFAEDDMAVPARRARHPRRPTKRAASSHAGPAKNLTTPDAAPTPRPTDDNL